MGSLPIFKPHAPLGGAAGTETNKQSAPLWVVVVRQAKQAPMRAVIRKHKHPLVK